MKKLIILLGLSLMVYSCAWFKTEPKIETPDEKTTEELRAEEMRLAMADNLVSDGITYYQVGKDSLAVQSWKRALEIIPYDAEVYNFIGISLHRMGEIEKALSEFDMAVNLKADYYEAHNNLGYMSFLLGHYDEALLSFNNSLEIEPSYEPAQKNKKLTESVISGNLSKKAFEIAEKIATANRSISVKEEKELVEIKKALYPE